MTHTTQARSWASLSKPGKDLTTDKDKPDKPEDNIDLLLSVFDSLNKLNDNLSRLDYVLKSKNIEKILIFDSLNKLNDELIRLGL